MNLGGSHHASSAAPSPGAPPHSGGYLFSSVPPAPFSELPNAPPGHQSHAEPDRFTSDDRLMLKLIYYQQQSIQAQLNSVLSWAEQINARITALDARTAPARSGSPRGDQDPLARRPSPQNQRVPQEASQWSERHTAHTTATTTTTAMTTHPNAHNISTASNNTAFEQRSCTPPGAMASPVGGAAAGRAAGPPRPPATSVSMNESVESVTAAWNPRARDLDAHSASAAVDDSFRSSRVSQLGRGENPLLHSRHSSATGAGSHSAFESSSLSQVAGAAAVGSARPAPRPASRLPSADVRPLTSTSQRVYEDPTRVPWRSTAHESQRTAPIMSAPVGAHERNALDAAAHVVMAEREVPAFRRLPVQAGPVHGTGDLDRTSERHTQALQQSSSPAREERDQVYGYRTPPLTSTASTNKPSTTHARPALPETRREEPPAPPDVERDYADVDSLSDGYGSYESRQYIQSIGLL